MQTWKKKTITFLISQGITLFGSSLVQFAIVWYVTLKTSSGAWVSALTICSFVPQFLISFFSGVWADRYPRKRLIILSDSVIAAVTLALALLMPFIGEDTKLYMALLAASVIRSLGAGVQTPAVGAMIPQLVPAEQLMRFNGINATLQSVVQFAAPAAAGAILTFGTLRSTLFIDIATAAIGIGILSCVAIPKLERKAETPSVFSEMKQGMKYAFSNVFVGKLLISYGIFIFLAVPAGFLATLFVSRTYGDSYFYLTLVELIGFAGMAAGGVLIGAWGGFPNRVKTLLVGLAAFGALGVTMGAIRSFPVYLALMVIYGIALTMVQTAVTTLIQEKSEANMQGRVFGFLSAMYSGCLPIGMAVFGPLADAVSMRLLMIATGGMLLMLAGIMRLDKNIYIKGQTKETQK
ncbi:putative bacilysin exporter BacE [bioreactor metagenome]|uniref:Putative bacilysin exporter BacE n=1 Tax=bioreactor metagenome TaxID=1076179 RepID=A0A644WJ08_9ZZZZ